MRNYLILLLLIFSINLFAQTPDIKQKSDSISTLFNLILKSKTDKEKIAYNENIKQIFAELLKNTETFDYPFLELKFVSKLVSEDGKLKIYTWNIPYETGEFEYFGFVQLRKAAGIELIELKDKSKKIKQPENKTLSANNWYGALYYKILTNSYKGKTYYTLLGWDGNDNFTNKKIIDILTYTGKKIQFGSPILKMQNDELKKRIIFEYSEQAKMMLSYDEKIKMIVFDHLAPEQKKFKGQYMYYGPDMSQDGLVFENGLWILKENLDLRNPDNNKGKKPIKTSF
ncbi:MAG: hypothetical protein L3J74_12875 [Bacteroidales bacterium]|nr:hypothetical protein [Bacteroidales bacterium]